MASHRSHPVLMPSEVSERVGPFDVFAGWSSRIASRAAFFTFCVALVVVWAPSYFLAPQSRYLATDHQHGDDHHHVPDGGAVAEQPDRAATRPSSTSSTRSRDGLADLMAHVHAEGEGRDLNRDLVELRAAVGLEAHESTSGNRAPYGAKP